MSKQSKESLEQEQTQEKTIRGYMSALDSRVAWERVDDGIVFTLWLTGKGNSYLVVRSIGGVHPWIEVFQPVDTGNRWDTMFNKMLETEEATP